MKTQFHKWRETPFEKLLFMNTTANTTNPGRYSAHNSRKAVNFYCAAPAARTVELAGDFNHWHPLPMERSLDGWWFATVELHHGHHTYRFLVDGQPMLDPHATGVVRDEEGRPASLVAVS